MQVWRIKFVKDWECSCDFNVLHSHFLRFIIIFTVVFAFILSIVFGIAFG